jgi:hypothetical protein
METPETKLLREVTETLRETMTKAMGISYEQMAARITPSMFHSGGVISNRMYPHEFPTIITSEHIIPRAAAMRLFESVHLPAQVLEEDWSEVRSPGRARRRLKQGHRQNIKHVPKEQVFVVGGDVFASPATVEKLRQTLVERQDKEMLNALYGRITR